MRKIIFSFLLLIGITILFDAEKNTGFIYKNDSTENTCIIIMRSLGKVEWLWKGFDETIPDFFEKHIEVNPQGISPRNIKAIIVPKPGDE